MAYSRRRVMSMGGATLATLSALRADATPLAVQQAIDDFTGGADILSGGVDLTLPDLAEDGYSVDLSVAARGATSIALFAPANPNPMLATFTFGPMSATQHAETHVRLAASQDITAIAAMRDGTFRKTSTFVTVIIGGCGRA